MTPEAYRELAESAWAWVLRQVRDPGDPWLPSEVADDGPTAPAPEDRDSLYDGIAGLAPVLAEVAEHRSWSDEETRLAAGIVARLSSEAPSRLDPSLYGGLAGHATALRLLAPGHEEVAVGRIGALATPAGWTSTLGDEVVELDLVSGAAGIVLAALWVGGAAAEEVAATGAESLLRAADVTPAGLDWGPRTGVSSRMPNYSHGTAGVGAALAVAGASLDRPGLVEAAVRGAQHLLAVGSLDGGGFVLPHTIPPSTRDVEPVTYTWCHGPAGTSYLFAALQLAGVEQVNGHAVADLRRRCLRSILVSGVPQRLRPGFWDNDGRCCGTAGVGEVLLDAAQDSSEDSATAELLAAARAMGDALVDRAVRDDEGARWQFIEHRREPPLLAPGTSWMQGAAGIAAYLFRLARVIEDPRGAAVVDRPDQWWAVPAHLRTRHTDRQSLPPR